MTQQQQATVLIDAFVDLQRIKNAGNRDREIEDQEVILKAKLEILGIDTEDLIIQ